MNGKKPSPDSSPEQGSSGGSTSGPGAKENLERTAKGPQNAGVAKPAPAVPVGSCPSDYPIGDPLPDDMKVNRIGGSAPENLAPKEMKDGTLETTVNPIPPHNKREVGISVTEAGNPQDAADQMRREFKGRSRIEKASEVVGSATAADIRAAGFEVIHDPSSKLPNHASIIHPAGEAGWTPENREKLSKVFTDTKTPATKT